MTTPVHTADRTTPAGARAAWVAAVAARDPDALRSLLTHDYEVWANATPPLRGVDAAIGAMRGALARYHRAPPIAARQALLPTTELWKQRLRRCILCIRSQGRSSVRQTHSISSHGH